MRMSIANNIKSTLPGIENQNAKDFLKLAEENFCFADKALARTLMAELTTMKLDGLKSMQQHVFEGVWTQRLKLDTEFHLDLIHTLYQNKGPGALLHNTSAQDMRE
nr:hypothetical protein [Tanacetum cinerariifolium]